MFMPSYLVTVAPGKVEYLLSEHTLTVTPPHSSAAAALKQCL